jgi:hypothetical protein
MKYSIVHSKWYYVHVYDCRIHAISRISGFSVKPPMKATYSSTEEGVRQLMEMYLSSNAYLFQFFSLANYYLCPDMTMMKPNHLSIVKHSSLNQYLHSVTINIISYIRRMHYKSNVAGVVISFVVYVTYRKNMISKVMKPT